jgi:translation elongation factor EF-Tu-like GTPase
MRQIVAHFTLVSTQDGGRQTPIRNEYCPAFYLDDFQTDGAVFLTDKTELAPGESCLVRIKLLHPENFGEQFKLGAELVVKEALKTIGKAKIVSIDPK